MHSTHGGYDANSIIRARPDIYFPVTPQLDSSARVTLIQAYAETLLENGTITTNAEDTIVLYDILRYFHSTTRTPDARATEAAMTLLKETLALIDVLSHGHKGPLSITQIDALLSETVGTIPGYGLEFRAVYLNPDPSRKRYFGNTPAPWGQYSLKRCLEIMERWRGYVRWCANEKLVERGRIRNLDDAIRRGLIPRATDIIGTVKIRSPYLRYQEDVNAIRPRPEADTPNVTPRHDIQSTKPTLSDTNTNDMFDPAVRLNIRPCLDTSAPAMGPAIANSLSTPPSTTTSEPKPAIPPALTKENVDDAIRLPILGFEKLKIQLAVADQAAKDFSCHRDHDKSPPDPHRYSPALEEEYLPAYQLSADDPPGDNGNVAPKLESDFQ